MRSRITTAIGTGLVLLLAGCTSVPQKETPMERLTRAGYDLNEIFDDDAKEAFPGAGMCRQVGVGVRIGLANQTSIDLGVAVDDVYGDSGQVPRKYPSYILIATPDTMYQDNNGNGTLDQVTRIVDGRVAYSGDRLDISRDEESTYSTILESARPAGEAAGIRLPRFRSNFTYD